VAEVARRGRPAREIGALGLPPEAAGLSLRELRDLVERQVVLAKLEENDWNISRTAQVLGLERTNLHKKMRALGIAREDRQGS